MRSQSLRRETLALEIVLKPLDLLLLAIHVDRCRRKGTGAGPCGSPRGSLQLDRIELEQQIEAESARPDASVASCVIAKLVRSARAESKIPTAACCALLPEKNSGSGFNRPRRAPFSNSKYSQCGCGAQHRNKNLIDHFAAIIQRPEFDMSPERDDFQRRTNRCRNPSANSAPEIHNRRRDRCLSGYRVIAIFSAIHVYTGFWKPCDPPRYHCAWSTVAGALRNLRFSG